MSGMGQNRKCRCFDVTSALPLIADINGRDCNVRFVPEADQLIFTRETRLRMQ